MMKLLAALFLPSLLAASALHAQGAPPQRILLQTLDRDGNGELSPAEIEAASASLLKLDRNHDGQLSPDEIQTTAARRSDPRGRPLDKESADGILRFDPVVNALDYDHDGILSAAEIASASGALKALDKDADGTLSADELQVRQQTPRERAEHLFDERDTNKDGGLTKAELPDRMQPLFSTIDLNHDGKIDREEATTYFATRQSSGPASGSGREHNPPRDRMPQNDAPSAPSFPPAAP